jgi:hypothetical protein
VAEDDQAWRQEVEQDSDRAIFLADALEKLMNQQAKYGGCKSYNRRLPQEQYDCVKVGHVPDYYPAIRSSKNSAHNQEQVSPPRPGYKVESEDVGTYG